MSRQLASFFTAVRFLTIVPVPWFAEKDGELHKDSASYFIPVGLCIGFFGVALLSLLSPYLPKSILCSLVIFYLCGVSGFLHLDGLADTADGLLSHRNREKKLSIMRDSRTGAMGVIALLLIFLFKYSALSSFSPKDLIYAVFFLPVAGRSAIVISMCTLPYARQEGGLGQLFYIERRKIALTVAVLAFLICAMFLGLSLVLTVLLATITTSLFFGFWCRKSLGGATGDTLGASCELTETVTAVFLAIYFH